MFGREHRHEHQHQHQPPQTSSSHLSYPMTPTSRMMAGQDAIPGPPPVSAISTSSTMAMPQTSTSGTGGLGATPAPLPTATTTGREGFQPFTAYTTPMPPSPFAITNLPVLPPVVEGGRDSRRQGFPVGGPSFGRDEPARAEDALRGGLSRQSSGLAADEDRRRREKDRDNLMRERDGPQRMNGPSLGDQAQQKRVGMGIQNMEIVSMTQKWSEDFQKGLMENNREREREEAGKISLGLGKRERERDEEEAAKEKKKKHHHHHNHNHHSHVHAGMVHHHHKAEEEVGAPNLEVPVSRAGARSKSPNSLAHMHHPHMHHPHHNTPIIHHHHNASASASAAAPQPKVKTSLLIDSTKVTASLSKPRNFLGSVIYHPTATPKQGYSVTHTLLPRFEGKENSIFQVRIPRRYLSEQQRKEVHRRRCVWGTEVYTDDSDVMAALIHLGKIPGVMPPDVDPAWVAEYGARKITTNGQTSASPRSPLVPSPTKKKVNGAGGKAEKQQVQDIPVIPAGKDLIVNLLILPTLERYTGSTCNGLKSRSWGTIHDGMSYSVWDIEWVEAGEAEARGGGSKKRRLDERDFVRRWGELPLSRGGMGNNGWSKNRWTVSGDGRGGGSKGKVAEVGA
ncbi:Rxt3-domain-containing protein [Morchella conica CCBAS932]|uniref:Rxt3-domain-containing protein n=1 Tax=Morchella conica CCBAS932 TaxID=1392247 RepID=A0A3N4KRB2_9PEZI|nr:Rxt3-domain-containing protein [Morchella conica CCBAS932]